MHTSIYLLITIGVIDGFFMRPLHMFVIGKGFKLIKFVNQQSLAIMLFVVSMLTGIAITMSSIYLTLKLAGFIPLDGHEEVFVASLIVGGILWVLYARRFNRVCSIDLD